MTPAPDIMKAAREIAAGIVREANLPEIAQDIIDGKADGLASVKSAVAALQSERSSAAAEIERLRALVSDGWLFLNPDTGTEWSEQHPVESGEVPDAADIRPATAGALHEELIPAWEELHKLRAAFDARGDNIVELSEELAKLRALVKEAGEVVRPFADEANFFDGYEANHSPSALDIQVHELRAARAFLDKLEGRSNG